MHISSINPSFIPALGDVLVNDMFCQDPGKWDIPTAEAYLRELMDGNEDLCRAVVDEQGNCLGACFAGEFIHYKGKALFVEVLVVLSEHQGKGVGKMMMKWLADQARARGLQSIHLVADKRKPFPHDWYEHFGLHETGWVHMEASIDEITL